MSAPTVAPTDHDMPYDTARRLADLARRHGGHMAVGPRVLDALVAELDARQAAIYDLVTQRARLRADVDKREARDLEAARLRAHALHVATRTGGA